jgi:hypothetical protein
MRDGKIVQIVPAEAGWSAVLPADGVDRVRLAPVACWAIVEGATGGREVVPLVAGPSRALVTPDPEALGIAGPGESAADWAERIPRLDPPPPEPTPAPRTTPTPPPSPRADIPGGDVLDD